MRCADAILKAFNKCERTAVRCSRVDSGAMERCLGEDSRGKIAKACDPTTGKIRSAIDKKCGAAGDLSIAFPGCGAGDVTTLATCLDEIVECQACLALNKADALSRDCDDFDDGVVNSSCGVAP